MFPDPEITRVSMYGVSELRIAKFLPKRFKLRLVKGVFQKYFGLWYRLI
jgi:hypothetical protein